MKRVFKYLGIFFLVLLCFSLLAFGLENRKSAKDFFAMDTNCSAVIVGRNSDKAITEITQVIDELDKKVISRFEKNSLIYAANQIRTVNAESQIYDYIKTLLEVSEKSYGAFDFTLGAVSDLWSFTDSPKVPDEIELADTLAKTGFTKIEITKEAISFPEGVVLDFGGAGKGIGLDETKIILDKFNIKNALIVLGGSVMAYGDKSFNVGIKIPENTHGYMAILSLKNECVSTSGGYERSFEEKGKTYHHILNPKTGMPADNFLKSVTVICESGILSDALSTACFVLGLERGTALARLFEAKAVFINNKNEVYTVGDFEDGFEITDSSYKLV